MQSDEFCDQLLIEIQTAQDGKAKLQILVNNGRTEYEERLNYLRAYIKYLWNLYNVVKARDIYAINMEISGKLTSLKNFNDGIDRTALKVDQIKNIIYFISELLKAVAKFGV